MSHIRTTALALIVGTCIAATAANAETCWDRAAAGSGPSRDAALRQAFQTMVGSIDPQLMRSWVAANMRVGELPGHAVRKLSVNCTQSGGGQSCRIEGTICKP